ncbi:hypothetical protein ANN_01155 [Periplaneta americana]|uniref:Uncharacterized protein n=1 Tax=Periplaneta americana TaxID=6978 RepID=A0ABQ8TUG3_PERAM|nr:hypothetical protein ANN_01155 [Periplaneta americana]
MTFTVTGAFKFSQHSVVQFLAAEGVSPIEIHRPMKKMYVDNCMLRARVYEWTKRYQQGRTSLEDGRPAPWPVPHSHHGRKCSADSLIRVDRRCTIDKVTQNLNISHGSAYSKIHDRLKYH